MGAGVEWRILSVNYINFCFVVYIRDSVPNGTLHFEDVYFS
ncbi:hypothetical protein C8R27_10464 [Nitrosomonas ureae]|nr:hypothetical protein C8R27_10464 [Nitrosomonas ureae]